MKNTCFKRVFDLEMDYTRFVHRFKRSDEAVERSIRHYRVPGRPPKVIRTLNMADLHAALTLPMDTVLYPQGLVSQWSDVTLVHVDYTRREVSVECDGRGEGG